MAPSAKKIEQALVDGTCAVRRAEPDGTSVNKVRRHVAAELGLDEDFFVSDQWKAKSKTIIKATVDKLDEGWEPEAKPEKKSKNGAEKRQSSDEEEEKPQPKRRKNAKAAKPVKKEISDASDEEEKPAKKSIAQRGARPAASSDVDDSEGGDDGEKKVKGKESSSPERKRKRKIESEEEDEDVAKRESSEEKAVKDAASSGDDEKPEIKREEAKPAVDEEDEYSDVIDEVPAPKRKRGPKKEKDVKKERRESKKKSSSEAKNTDLDPHEAEIKKLQGQLTKCGVRKLWHNELKKYGSDSKGKIRHLRGMLADVGMEGRFSEHKAREIKEMRELQAEVEAAEEMNKLWGTEGRMGRGAKRGKARGVKDEESDGEDGVEDKGGGGGGEAESGDEDEGESFAARRRRAQADLAFLGDDSDSD